MKFNNKRDSPDCTLTKIILISYLLSNVIMFFVMYNPWAYKRVYCPVTPVTTETTIETEPVITTYVVENIDYIQPKSAMIPETVVEIEEEPTYSPILEEDINEEPTLEDEDEYTLKKRNKGNREIYMQTPNLQWRFW